MLDYFPEIYRQLEAKIDDCYRLNSHLLIVTLPGLGATHLLHHYLNFHPQSTISYLNTPGQEISEYNFLDLNFDANPNALSQTIDYFSKANYRQKFAVIINTPAILTDDTFLHSVLPRRLLSSFYLPAFSHNDLEQFLHLDNPRLTEKEVDTIYQLSGGICRLAKFLSTHPHLLSLSPQEIARDLELAPILEPTLSAIKATPASLLTKLNINSPIINAFAPSTPNIKINLDLTFSENGQPYSHSLNKIESQILNHLIQNDYFISREKVAEFKWGKSQYDEFSDLAISKTMRRLKNKLTVYTLKTIPKTGWQLVSV